MTVKDREREKEREYIKPEYITEEKIDSLFPLPFCLSVSLSFSLFLSISMEVFHRLEKSKR